MKVSGTRTNLTEPNQALQRINVLVTDHAPSSMLRAKHVYRWAWTFGRIKTISELVMRIAKNCVYLLTLNMRINIETAARTPIQNRKVHAESDFGIRICEFMIQVCEFGKGTVMRKPKDFKWLKSDSQINRFQFFDVQTNTCAWKSLEPETQTVQSRTKRYSE
jgi:hypothetical protein